MKCQVTFRHMKASDPLRLYAEEKITKLNKLIDEERTEAHVVLSVEKHQQLAHLELIIGGALRARADERGEDMYSVIDLAVDKLLKQVRRFRDKVRDHHRAENNKGREVEYEVTQIDSIAPVAAGEIAQTQVVRKETMVAKEMNVDDAIVQMDLLNSDFLVFTNTNSQRMSFMYRLPDGRFGLIEAQQSQ